MIFNSIQYALFLPVIFLLHWLVFRKSLKMQNYLLLAASYFFYSCWNWHFLFLLIFSTFLDYYSGLKIAGSENEKVRKFWFWLSIGANLAFLGVFKYYNFFAGSFADMLSRFGFSVHPWTLSIILPVGISFYTFHGLSYVIDIYKRRIEPEKDWVIYSLFVSYFPLLVAGPIERATHLLPQLKVPRKFDLSQAADGMRQILWGLFKKVVIADNCAQYANVIFDNSGQESGGMLVLGAVFFAFQIYGDFSGYSDIALGTSKLFGPKLMVNFRYPYFSRDIAEFWRRWHISLSSWFRDYVYIPLGGSKGGKSMQIRNTFVIFLLSGFWHGANWTYIFWGFINALYFLPLLLTKRNRTNMETVATDRVFPNGKELRQMLATFGLACLAWIFFRSATLSQAFEYISRIFSPAIFYKMELGKLDRLGWTVAFVIIFLLLEWQGRLYEHPLQKFGLRWKRGWRYALYLAFILCLFLYGGREQQFIYFQF